MALSQSGWRRVAADMLRDELEMDGLKTSALSDIFENEPPPLNTFLYDSAYLNHLRPTNPFVDESGYKFTLSPIQYDLVRSFEQIFKPELYIAMVEEFGTEWAPLPMKNMYAVCFGKGSGKDSTIRIGFVRIISLLQHLKSPQGYYGMASFDSIHLLNVAVNAPQARDAFFDPMKKLFISNKHLSEMFNGDDPAEGAGRIKLKKNITIISGHSLAENLEGLNLIAGVADEISAFKTAEEYASRDGRSDRGADAIVGMLQSSATSRFPETYKVAQISWPRFHNDAIMKAISKGNESIARLGDKSPWYVSGPYATWEVNPKVKREDFDEQFIEDPEGASAKYGANPPKSTNTFIRAESEIDAAFETVIDEPVTVDYYWGLPDTPDPADGSGQSQKRVEGWQVKFSFSPSFQPVEGALYSIHGDMALRGDRAGIAMSHVKEYRTSTTGDGTDERPVIKNDFTFSFTSDLSDRERPREVQIRWYRQLVWELIDRGFAIENVTFDQWQSFDMVQFFNSYGISSRVVSLDRNDRVYQAFKDIILDGRLIGYRTNANIEPLYSKEIKRLRKVGKKVDHPPSGSKDEADALAGSVYGAMEIGGSEDSDFAMADFNESEQSSIEDMLLWQSPSAGPRGGNGFGLFGAGNLTQIPRSSY